MKMGVVLRFHGNITSRLLKDETPFTEFSITLANAVVDTRVNIEQYAARVGRRSAKSSKTSLVGQALLCSYSVRTRSSQLESPIYTGQGYKVFYADSEKLRASFGPCNILSDCATLFLKRGLRKLRDPVFEARVTKVTSNIQPVARELLRVLMKLLGYC
eukprot:sb/3472931/